MPNPRRLLLWTDSPGPYVDAIANAGLARRVAVETLARKDQPSAAQLENTDAMLAAAVAPGLLPQMPKLRWVQALTAGVEGCLALPDLPSGLTLSCARGTHRESMAENILGALFWFGLSMSYRERALRGQLFSIRYVTPVADRVFRLER